MIVLAAFDGPGSAKIGWAALAEFGLEERGRQTWGQGLWKAWRCEAEQTVVAGFWIQHQRASVQILFLLTSDFTLDEYNLSVSVTVSEKWGIASS